MAQLNVGDTVTAEWTWGGHRFQASGVVTKISGKTVKVRLTEHAGEHFAPGFVVTVPTQNVRSSKETMMARAKPGQRQWQGTNRNEASYNSAHNALVGIILDGVAGVSPELPGHGWRMVPLEKADQYIEKGRRVLADFESQACAPGGARGQAQKWMDRHIDALRKLVADAEAVRAGKRPQKQTPEDYEKLRKSLGVSGARGVGEARTLAASDVNFQNGERIRIRVIGPKGQLADPPFWFTVTGVMSVEDVALQFTQTLQPGMFVSISDGKNSWTFQKETHGGQNAVRRLPTARFREASESHRVENHRVADFNTLDDLIRHARDELGATHVLVDDANTKLYFPRGGTHPYEEAAVWRKSGYWHAQGPGARTGVTKLPAEAQPIGGGRAGRRVAEAPRTTSGRRAAPLIDDKLYAVTWAGGRQGNLSDRQAVDLVRQLRNDWRQSGRNGILNIQVYYRDGSTVPYADLERRVLGTTKEARSRTTREYIAVDNRGRTIAGPFKTYGDAKSAAGPANVVQFVPARAQRASEARPSPRSGAARRPARITLGRDGMGSEADEADFDAWVAYVSARIDERTGLDVTVEERGPRDVQDDAIRADSEQDEQTIREALHALWEDFSADTSAWPTRTTESRRSPRGGAARRPDPTRIATDLARRVNGSIPRPMIDPMTRTDRGIGFSTYSPEYGQPVIVVVSSEDGGNIALSIYSNENMSDQYESINTFLYGPDGYTWKTIDVNEMVETIKSIWEMVDGYAESWQEGGGGELDEARRSRGIAERLYHVIAINERTGKKEYLTSTPMTHREAVTILSKQRPHRDIRKQLEPAEGTERGGEVARATRSTHRRTAAAMAESRRGPEPVDDPFYVIQGLYNGPEAYIAGASFGFDDEPTAIAEAKKLSKSPYFEGDYVRIITRDGELVWDSRSGGTRETTRRPKAQRRRR